MNKLPILTVGDTWVFKGELTVGDGNTPSQQIPYNCSSATEIKAVIKKKGFSIPYCDEVTLSSGTPGADWTNGILVHKFPPATTAQISQHISRPTTVEVEVQVTLGGDVFTWTAEVSAQLGAIN